MAISLCNKCGTIAEHERALVGSQTDCLQCGVITQIYDTLFFVNKLSKMYLAQRKELNSFRAPTPEMSGNIESGNLSESFDIHNSNILSSELQHKPIIQWLKTKNIVAATNVSSVDTIGFFDEAAVMISSNYTLFGEICKRIQYAQQKEHNSVTIQFD